MDNINHKIDKFLNFRTLKFKLCSYDMYDKNVMRYIFYNLSDQCTNITTDTSACLNKFNFPTKNEKEICYIKIVHKQCCKFGMYNKINGERICNDCSYRCKMCYQYVIKGNLFKYEGTIKYPIFICIDCWLNNLKSDKKI
jgi:hypothetical protein